MTVNVGAGGHQTLNETIRLLNKISGYDVRPQYARPREGDIKHSFADISRAHELLDYQPRVGFEEGLRRTLEWHRSFKAD
jgi:UDP-N-acetylglucosamine/UDP-N-acetyl-alpha-D-glucosaminouronate 4-epimerase